MSVSNMKLCEDIFKQYMKDEYDVDVTRVSNVRVVLYKMMEDMCKREAHKTMSLRELNKALITQARDQFLGAKSQTSRGGSLFDRDRNLYGDRSVMYNRNIPTAEARPKYSESDLETVLADRNKLSPDAPSPEVVASQQPPEALKETALPLDAFLCKVNDLKNERGALTLPAETVLPPEPVAAVAASNGLAFGEASAADDKTASAALGPPEIRPGTGPAANMGGSASAPSSLYFLAFNSGDRDWILDPQRYRYRVNMTGYEDSCLMRTYRNVRALQVTHVIIPMEISQHHQSSATNYVSTKRAFNYEFSLAHPYLLLMLDGVDSLCDGTNEPVRRSFCTLIYEQSYKSPNGRGYIVLKPIAEEKKTYDLSPLSMLNIFNVMLAKPNGAMLNNSRDDYQVYKVEYEPFNKLYLKIVTDRYFDKNEFYAGDSIMIRNCALPDDDPSSSSFNAFINRREGHEIVEIGQPNDSGFYRTFHILAPGTLDATLGKIVVDQPALDAVQAFNVGPTSGLNIGGDILNASLQNVVGMKVWAQ